MNVQASPKTSRVPTSAVIGFITDAMQKSGVPAADSAKIAELMLEADLVGADAHGVFRLPQYVQRLKLGSTNARPTITVTRSAEEISTDKWLILQQKNRRRTVCRRPSLRASGPALSC